jgi:hypothetical protein
MKGVYFGVLGKAAVPESIRLPKNFQPVGTSKFGILSFWATRSSAHEVGMERAQPLSPPAKYGMHVALATIMARESEGDTKKREPMIMLRSASPSAAAPKEGGSLLVSMGRPILFRPILATSSTACVRLGSACPWEAECGPFGGGGGDGRAEVRLWKARVGGGRGPRQFSNLTGGLAV